MEPWLSVSTLIWLFPVVFIIHDFEEIILVERWTRNTALIYKRLPERMARRVIQQFSMTTAQFAVSVLVIFAFVSSSTYLASQYVQQGPFGNIHPFVVCTLVFFLHLFTHLAQAVWFRSITPGSVTSLAIILPYSIVLFHSLFAHGIITWGTVWTSLPYVVLIVPIVLMSHWIGRKALR